MCRNGGSTIFFLSPNVFFNMRGRIFVQKLGLSQFFFFGPNIISKMRIFVQKLGLSQFFFFSPNIISKMRIFVQKLGLSQFFFFSLNIISKMRIFVQKRGSAIALNIGSGPEGIFPADKPTKQAKEKQAQERSQTLETEVSK